MGNYTDDFGAGLDLPDDSLADSSDTGGHGGCLTAFADSYTPTHDARMIERAIADRWPVSPEVRESCIQMAAAMVRDPNAKRREKIAAFRGLQSADRLNLIDRQQRWHPELGQTPAPQTNIGSVNIAIGESAEVDRLRAMIDQALSRTAIPAVVDPIPSQIDPQSNGNGKPHG